MPAGVGTRDEDRRYYGGALFWLTADVAIRKRTNNARGVQDAMKERLIENLNLRIKARPGANNSVLAIELERRSADNRVLFEGPVSATSGTSTLTILGVVVDTTRVAESEFKDVSGPSLGRAAFFARLGTGGLAVKARGTLGAGNAVIWDQMEIED